MLFNLHSNQSPIACALGWIRAEKTISELEAPGGPSLALVGMCLPDNTGNTQD